MPDNPNPNGPAQMQIGETGDNPQGAAGASGEVMSALEAARAELKEMKQQQEQLRSLHDRQMNQLRQQFVQSTQQRMARDDTGSQDFGETDSSGNFVPRNEFDMLQERLNQESIQNTLNELRIRDPQFEDKYRDRVLSIINDPNRAGDVAVWNPQTRAVDFRRSIQNAYDKVRLEDFQKIEAESANQKQKQSQERSRQLAQATISGGGAGPDDETIVDTSNMTSDEMLKKGLVPEMDEADPIKPRRRG